MKTKLPLIAAIYCGLCASGSAFTLDFFEIPPGPISSPLRILVPHYGYVEFQAGPRSELVVNSAYMNSDGSSAPSLSFDEREQVDVTFVANPHLRTLNVDFDYVGLSDGEEFNTEMGDTPNAFEVTLVGSGDGAGIYKVSWDADCVPEPSTSLLGALGATLLVLRRRR